MKGKVQTVLGCVEPESLGMVLTHEHLRISSSHVFLKPPLCKPHQAKDPITLHNVGWVRQYPYSCKSNMEVFGAEVEEDILKDVARFKSLGGGTIVECTTTGINNDMNFMKKVSEKTGVNVVAGTGFYIDGSQSESTKALSEEKMFEMMVNDLQVGCADHNNVKCGVIGEMGSSWPITDFERRALRAAGAAESATGSPVMIHPGREPEAPPETLRIFAEAGGNVGRAVMAHLDRTFDKVDQILELASLGSFLEYDLFGIETSLYQNNPRFAMLSDAQRIEMIKHLIQNGFEDRVVISHDIHTKHRLEAFGGHGFCHIIETVLPIMKIRGISDDEIAKMTIHNPARWLAFVK